MMFCGGRRHSWPACCPIVENMLLKMAIETIAGECRIYDKADRLHPAYENPCLWRARGDAAPSADEAVGTAAGCCARSALFCPWVGGKSTRKETANPSALCCSWASRGASASAGTACLELARAEPVSSPAGNVCAGIWFLSLCTHSPRTGGVRGVAPAGSLPMGCGAARFCPHLEDIFEASGNDVTAAGVLPGEGDRRGTQPRAYREPFGAVLLPGSRGGTLKFTWRTIPVEKVLFSGRLSLFQSGSAIMRGCLAGAIFRVCSVLE